jgi:cob(I)alamin adenosyltransferase
MSGEWDVVVLDEVHSAVAMGMVPVEDLLALMRDKPEHVELVTTGQRAHEKVIDAADLVTEMRLIKHPFQKKIAARQGIEY